jgi:rubredoxin
MCADCGYIYEPGTTPAFEELRTKWKCPQCAGPRRRFVKKAGGQYGQIDDSPLYIGMGISFFFIFAALYVGLTV